MAFDAFLEISGVEGESTDKENLKKIEVTSFNSGVSQTISGTMSSSGSLTAERADFTPFVVTKDIDLASPLLNQYCAAGTHIALITFQLYRAGDKKALFQEYTLEKCIISGVSVGGSSGGDFPTETVSIEYGAIKWNYKKLDENSNLKGNSNGSWTRLGNAIS